MIIGDPIGLSVVELYFFQFLLEFGQYLIRYSNNVSFNEIFYKRMVRILVYYPIRFRSNSNYCDAYSYMFSFSSTFQKSNSSLLYANCKSNIQYSFFYLLHYLFLWFLLLENYHLQNYYLDAKWSCFIHIYLDTFL